MNDFTVGVEEEYQLIDPETGEIRNRASEVIGADWADEIRHEIQQTMLEIGTPVCGSATELDREVRRLRFQVAVAAAAQDLALVAAGLHPFSSWGDHEGTGDERYQRLSRRFGRVLRTEHVFGMHVHVAVPEGTDRIRLINRIRRYVPHLVALAASSPLYEGENTGYASYRTVLAQRFPCSGPVPRFDSEAQYWSVMRGLARADAIEDKGTLYWDIRPHATYPTIEVRCTDACPLVEDAVAIATLIRVLVVAAAEGSLGERGGPLPTSVADAVLELNGWQAARYGLDARLVGPASADNGEPARDAVRRLLDRVAPVAEELGDGEALKGVRALLERGNAAERIRGVWNEGGKCPEEVARWLARESALGTGLDRRGPDREHAQTGAAP